jgi:electron transfer flavoprotein beta subunit
MHDFHIVVCVKVVPKPEEIQVDPETRALIRTDVRSEINPPDMNALEMALVLKDKFNCKVNILSMGAMFFEPYLRVGLAMGADHIYLLSDIAFSGADTLATTYTLAKGIQKMGGADIIFCGEESSDGATGQVPPGIAEWLNYNQLTMVDELNVSPGEGVIRGKRGIKGGYEILEVPFLWSKMDMDIDEEYIGDLGSPTTVSDLVQASTHERKRIFLEGTQGEIVKKLAEIIKQSL